MMAKYMLVCFKPAMTMMDSSESALPQSGSGISNWRKSGKRSSSHRIALSWAVQPIGYLCTIGVFVKPNVVVDLYQKFNN
jgi:hypothetical protein